MKENIEEVIEFLQGFNDGYTFQQCKTCFKFNEKDGCCNKEKCEELEAIEYLISDYKRVLKENAELKEKWDKDTHILQNDLDIANAKKIELQKENEKLKKLITNKIGYTQQLEQDLYEKCSNYVIPKQKVKDKIEELEKAYEESKDEYGETPYYYPNYTIDVLQDLLEEGGK